MNENKPAAVAEWAQDDPHAYWQAADAHERANGRLYSEVQFALPRELDASGRRELAGAFAERVCAGERLPGPVRLRRSVASASEILRRSCHEKPLRTMSDDTLAPGRPEDHWPDRRRASRHTEASAFVTFNTSTQTLTKMARSVAQRFSHS